MHSLREAYMKIYQSQVNEAHYNPATGKIQAEKPSREEIAKLAREAAASGLKKRKPGRNSPTFKPSSREQAQADMKSWASYFGDSKNEEKGSYLEPDMKKRRKNNEKAIKDMENTQANRDMVDAVRKKFDEAVYGGEKPKPVKPVDTRLVVTNADKKANTKAYQLFKAGNSAYRAADHLKDELLYDDLYNFIIESLIKGGFVQDYKSAEHVIENMSDAWLETMAEEWRPVENLDEKARGTRKKTNIHAYDADETLFGHGKKGKPTVQVHVNDSSGKRVQSLSNQDFNTYKLDKDKGHSYDFSEFQSAKKFGETSSPNKKVIKDLRRKQARGQNVHIITARSKFDNPSEFQGHLQKHGIDIPKNKIHYTGGMKGSDVGTKKVDTAKGIAKQSGAKNISMYDDAPKVNNAFEKEKQNNSTFKKIKTYLAKPNASGETTLRSYQATK